MLEITELQARQNVQKLEGVLSIEAMVRYNNLYVVRVILSSKDEEHYDPFFSVDVHTGEVKDFSVLHDGDIVELTRLFLLAEDNEFNE
jgi:hypothetical protein